MPELRLEVDNGENVVENRIGVRKAEEGDIPWILEELKSFDALQGRTRIPLLPASVAVQAEILTALIRGPHPFFVATRGSRRMGFLCGVVSPHVLNPAIRVAYQCLFWVPPRNRRTVAAHRLLDFFEGWCRTHVDWAFFSIHHDTAMAARHLEKRGFEFVESTFRLEV